MENYSPIQETFITKSSENKIIKKRYIIIPLVILLAGIAVLLLPLPETVSAKLHWVIKPFIGLMIICLGAVKLVKAPQYQYTVTGKPVKQKKAFYNLEDKDYLLNCLVHGHIKQNYAIKESSNTALALNVYVESNKNFVAAQLQQFVPYEYQSITDTLFFHGEQAKGLCKALAI